MTVGIIGLGLIGGSMAKAYKKNSDAVILAADRDSTIVEYARLQGVVDGVLTADTIPSCDLILIALYPQAAIEYMKDIAPLIAKDALVIDLCGTKRTICEAGFALAEQYGFTFVGGHPMAGTQYSGFKHARENLFHGASMVLVPPTFDDIFLLDRVKKALAPAGFGRMTVTTADQHDEMIAFTSQLAHVVSNAYVKSPTARSHKGFSAGSYKDLTRVARLNEEMWSELFIENKEHLVSELDTLIASLTEYRDAIRNGDTDTTRTLLKDGREAKESIDGK
jgi:prephenate dehydrogenase